MKYEDIFCGSCIRNSFCNIFLNMLFHSKEELFRSRDMIFRGTIKIEQEDDWYVATCFENNIASQGKTANEALDNLKEAIALYYEYESNQDELTALQNEHVYITRLEIAL